ncbi:MAG: endonuclease/exonuclease/phosphatase family protein [Planctomycetaceae bacterium]|nr:endonuclease/exonuclease/phosphatase family protein [Planctomycetaceae bacterium]
MRCCPAHLDIFLHRCVVDRSHRSLRLLGIITALLGCVPLINCDIAQAEELRVAFWNVENLFDQYVDKRVPTSDVFLPEHVQEKLEKDATIIRQLDADIVGLMEVENRGLLRELCEKHLADMGYRYFELSEETDDRGIDVAIISRRPFLSYSFEVPDFYRGVLVSRFSIDGEPLYVIVNHWKSRFEGGEDLRMSCARVVSELVNHQIPVYEGKPVPIIIGGDLNDDDTDASVVYLEQHDMTNTLKSIPFKERWTLPYNNLDKQRVEYNGFDHIFINPQLQDQAGIEWDSSSVVRPEIMTHERRLYGTSYTWPDDDDRDHIGYSDHYPVMTTIRLPQAK